MISPLISVIVATRNRADDLEDALASLEAQTLPASQFEIIVVDNGSTDDTKEVALSPRKLDSVIYIPEPRPGLSLARNAGVRAAHGDIIAFIDDDAVAAPNWLAELKSAHNDAGIQCVGGRIEGRWLCDRPPWFHPDLDPMLSILDLGDQPRWFTPPSNYPVGTNISFRREVFEKYGLFNTALGRGGSLFEGGEEVELFSKLRRGGDASTYWPRAVVHHKVGPDKLAPARLFRIAFGSGRLAARLREKNDAPLRRRLRMRRPKAPLLAILFRTAIKITIAAGYLWQSFRGLLPDDEYASLRQNRSASDSSRP